MAQFGEGMVEQVWGCPQCGVIVKVTEALPPLEFDAEKIIERKLLTCRINGLDKIMRRFRLGLPFLRLGCWLADMDLELKESEEGPSSSVGTDPPLLCGSAKPVAPATLEELDTELQYRKYREMEEHMNRLLDVQKWYESEKARLGSTIEGGSDEGAIREVDV